ncbi:MAG: glycosyltransferase family 2 protein [Solirubrobacteraceae bacterium]
MASPTLPADPRAAVPRVSVVIPCLDEAENIEECVGRARAALDHSGIDGEVIVVDNASDDDSAQLARGAGATVIEEPRRGYGNALLAGFDAARADYIVMADADLTYDFGEIPRFVHELDTGAELVLGDRMQSIQPGAMPWLNRYVGNPVLSGFLNLLLKTGIRDVHCGMRALRRDVLATLDLRTSGMEFASEMVIRASKAGLEIREFPIALGARGGRSKLSPLPDGWRHLRLILVFSPQFLFTLPGAVMMVVGVLIILTVLFKITLFGRAFYIHTEIAGSLLVIVGMQLVAFGLIARTFGIYFMGERDRFLERMRARFKLEHGLLLGGVITLAALAGGAVIVGRWIAQGLGTLGEGEVALVAATVLVLGVQIFVTSFLLSILGLRRPR